MIGFYDYTVILTYISLLSAGSGIVISLAGQGHPIMGMFCLLICGLCDSFDGIVARTKKNRTQLEKNYGIQIDSLSDVVAFGVLPACIGAAVFRRSELLHRICGVTAEKRLTFHYLLLHAILVLYILAALIRLAYFNVTEEVRQKEEGEAARREFIGLPVTSAALIFPVVLLADLVFEGIDLGLLYFGVAMLMALAFLAKIRVKKFGIVGILVMIGIGAIEAVLLIVSLLLKR